MSLLERFEQAMLGVPTPVVAAVSGGSDSVALLCLLHQIQAPVVVAHLDHALRPDSEQDARWVEKLAQRLGYTYECRRIEVGKVANQRKQNLEDTARTLRYSFLATVAKQHGAKAILTAHTQDDQAETLLMQLARGTARATGVLKVSQRVFRPLLGFSRLELQAFLLQQQQNWLEDPTNQSLELDRNFLRHQVLPVLQQRFPHFNRATARFAQIRQAEEPLLDHFAQRYLLANPRWPVPAFRVAVLQQAPPDLRLRVLRLLLERCGLRANPHSLSGLEQALDGRPCTLSQGWQAQVWGGDLFVIPPHLSTPSGWRNPVAGDRLSLSFGHKRLVEFLADQGVPKGLRRWWPVRGTPLEVWQLWPYPPEQVWMTRALQAARSNPSEVPIGAALVIKEQVLAVDSNHVETMQDARQHAEQRVLQSAMQKLGQKVLPGSTLVVTLEPCLMCYGAALETGVGRIVYGTENPKAGAFTRYGIVPQMAIEAGRLERECAKLLSGFFASLR